MPGDRDVLVVGSAPLPADVAYYHSVIRAASVVVAADGGLVLCLNADRTPDVCVGDFDSVDEALVERASSLGAAIRRYSPVKDASDLDLAVTVAREFGTRLRITAAFSGRVDHTLASFGTLLEAADLHGMALEPDWRAYALHKRHRAEVALAEAPGTVLSVLSPAGAVVSLDGVAYPLERGVLRSLSSLGLSNVASKAEQRVVVHEGSALLIVNARLPLS